MERIKEIWIQLESNSPAIAGLFKVRYSDTSKCDVYLGIKYPEANRFFIIRVPLIIGKEFNFRYEFKGLKFEKIYDPDDSQFLLLNLVLIDSQLKDIFDTLVLDIIAAIIHETEIKAILRNYTNRLVKWQSLFDKFNQQGLTPEEQRGLYGELFFIRKFLTRNPDSQSVLNSWVGPEKQIRDFQFGLWSVEVKTTHGNNHQKIQVSNERQLDTRNLDNLFLYHLSLESRQQSGETLNEIADSIIELLQNDFGSLNYFKSKLIEVGYFDRHKLQYTDTGYFIRQGDFYKVEKSFPRIEEKDIREGVGDIKYTIMVSQCFEFLRTEEEIFQTITFS